MLLGFYDLICQSLHSSLGEEMLFLGLKFDNSLQEFGIFTFVSVFHLSSLSECLFLREDGYGGLLWVRLGNCN